MKMLKAARRESHSGKLVKLSAQDLKGPWTENERAIEASTVTRIVDNLSATYDLDAVLTAIRDKVQRLADEQSLNSNEAREAMREAILALLSRCVRIARRSGWDGTGKPPGREDTPF